MNDMIKRPDYTPATTGESNPFLDYGKSALQRNIVGDLLKFSKGDWFAGQDERMVQEGTEFIVNMHEILIGWIRWQDNKPTDHVMGKVSDNYQKLRRADLGDTDEHEWDLDDDNRPRDPWQESNYMLLKGAHDGQLYTFTASSKGGRDSVSQLCVEYGKAYAMRPDEYPVVAIGVRSYEHPKKQYGRIKVPTFTIVDWAPNTVFRDDLGEIVVAPDEPEEAPEPEPAPAPQKPVPAPEPAPAPVTPPPAARTAGRTQRRI